MWSFLCHWSGYAGDWTEGDWLPVRAGKIGQACLSPWKNALSSSRTIISMTPLFQEHSHFTQVRGTCHLHSSTVSPGSLCACGQFVGPITSISPDWRTPSCHLSLSPVPLFCSPFCSSLSLPLSFSLLSALLCLSCPSLFPLFFLSILLCLFFSAALYLSSTFPSLPLLSSPSFPHPSNSHGTRLENCFKSTGHRCYHFNKLQLTLLPKLLTPPPYTCQKTD